MDWLSTFKKSTRLLVFIKAKINANTVNLNHRIRPFVINNYMLKIKDYI